MNWIGIGFSFILPGLIIIGMTAGIIWERREHKRAKRRHTRCHRPISTWQDLYVGK